MPSAFAHAGFALAACGGLVGRRGPPRLWLAAVACSVLPDADVVGFAFGIPYGDLLGHRGLSHSLAVAALVGVVVTAPLFRDAEQRPVSRRDLALFFFGVTASHGLFDAMTNGGLGIAFFSPFDPGRYFFPWRPIAVSPLRVSSFFGERGLRILASEALWVGLPSLGVMLGLRGCRRRSR